MDLLESILRTCDAEKYIPHFKNNGIDAFTLKILNEEDLKIIGVEEEVLRKTIIKHLATLQLPSESKTNIVIDQQYAYLITNLLSMQLNRHYANASDLMNRQDVELCDIKLAPASECVERCLNSLESKIYELEAKIFKLKKNDNKKKYVLLFPTLALASLALFTGYKYIGYLKN